MAPLFRGTSTRVGGRRPGSQSPPAGRVRPAEGPPPAIVFLIYAALYNPGGGSSSPSQPRIGLPFQLGLPA